MIPQAVTLQPLWPLLAGALALFAVTVVWAVRHWTEQRGIAVRALMISRVLVVLIAVGIALRPISTTQVDVPQERAVDVVVMLDRTTSMAALDAPGERPRMEAAADDLTALVEEVAGAHIAVQVFDDDARLAVPFTTDATSVTTFVQTVGWRPSAQASGSDISVGVEHAAGLLRAAATARPGHRRLLVYVGDGEQTVDTPPASFTSLRDLADVVVVLGYGTAEGAPMPTAPGSAELITVDDTVQKSRYDVEALRRIAEETGGEFHHRTGRSALPRLIESAPTPAVSEQRPSEDHAWLLALAAVPLLLHLLWAAVSGARVAREELA